MQDGYINEDGEYMTSPPRLFGSPVLVRETDDQFAEVVSGSVERLVIWGRTNSELFQDFLNGLTDPQVLTQFGRGFISYPDDIRWFLYGSASYANLLGPEAKRKNNETIAAVRAAITGDDVPSGRTKRAVLLSAYLNYTARRNPAGFAGRLAGGFVTTAFIQFLLNRTGLGFLVPSNGLPRFFAFFPPLFIITTLGSIVRVAEKHFDEYGHLENLGLNDILVAMTTGADMPGEAGRFARAVGANLASKLSNAILFCDADIREANDVWFGEDSARADQIWEETRYLHSQATQISSNLRYASSDDQFYDALIRAHNLAVRAQRLGCSAEGLDDFVILMDQTLLQCLDLFIHAIDAALVSQSGNYEYWQYVQRDLEQLRSINDPDYIEGGEAATE